MLATTIWLSFIAQSFAKDVAPHVPQKILNENVDSGTPVDYFDVLKLPNPHYKINYMYEQKRTDEDPEIEQIEEEIGKYMHYQPSTTTTTAEPPQNIDDVNENFKELLNHGPLETPIIVPETHDHKNEKEEVTSSLAPMPPAPKLRKPIHPHFSPALPATVLSPPITHWEELKEVPYNDGTGSRLERPEFPAHMPTLHRHPNHRLRTSPTTSESPVEEEAQINHASTLKHIHLSPTTQVPSLQNRSGPDALTKVKPILDDIKKDSIGLAPRPVYRGSYKFSWDDVNDMHTSSVPKVSQLKVNRILSVPTLSPWYDGYGK